MNDAKVMRFAELTRMTMDLPEIVAGKILRAVIDRKKDVFIGFPERFFVGVNALAPRLVDAVLAADTAKARQLFTP